MVVEVVMVMIVDGEVVEEVEEEEVEEEREIFRFV